MSSLPPALPLVMITAAAGAYALRRAPALGAWLVVVANGAALGVALTLAGSDARIQGAWLSLRAGTLNLGLRADGLASVLALVVAGAGLLVNLYAVGYAAHAADRPRFHAWMAFFVGAMLTLVLADSLLTLFVAWELVGLASWALIGFWFEDPRAVRAARRAFLLTRVTDLGLLGAWLVVFIDLGTTDLDVVLEPGRYGAPWVATLLVVAAIGKAAQLPLSAWLPDAMAGPTPVSALLHSATMVAAGVFLLVRMYPLLEQTPAVLTAVAVVGVGTAVLAAIAATAALELKRVLAWSTVSQLGEMFLAIGVAAPLAAVHHLVAHAAFKATLFAAAGSVERATGARDLRDLGGLGASMPWTAVAFAVASLALAGLPPLSGFFSERQLMAAMTEAGVPWAVVLAITIFLSGAYIARAFATTFLGPRRRPCRAGPTQPLPKTMRLGVGLLAITAVAVGGLVDARLAPALDLPRAAMPGATIGHIMAMAAAVLGLGFGLWRTRIAPGAPLLGTWSLAFDGLLDRGTTATGRAVLRVAHALESVEHRLAAAARGAAHGSIIAAGVVDRSERSISGAGDGSAVWVEQEAAAAIERGERRFAAAGDALANGLGRVGATLRRLQTGQLYLYTLGLFTWVLAAAMIGALLWLQSP